MKETDLNDEELARLHEAFARVPFARLLGMEFVSASRGAATFALEVREELTRMGGLLHGGAIASLLDTAAAFAVHTLLAGCKQPLHCRTPFLSPLLGPYEARARDSAKVAG